MMRLYGKWFCTFCILFIFLLWMGGSEVSAHIGSYGYSKWHVHDKSVEAIIVIDALSIQELAPAGRDKNEFVSDAELPQTFSNYILPYLTDKLQVYADGQLLPFQLTSIKKVNSNEIQMDILYSSKWKIGQLKIDYQLFFKESNNNHKNLAYIYTVNAENKPIEHVFNSNSPSWEGAVTDPVPFYHNLGQFIVLGIEHILTGYDHILFLTSLLLMVTSFRGVLLITTSFTIAHSITLILAATGVVTINSRYIEIAIALTICYVALENILKKNVKYRNTLTFSFGLIHGLGFANVLREIAIPKSYLISSLLSFNVGVEIGQVLIVLLVLPLLFVIRRKFDYRKITIFVSLVIFGLGVCWVIERVFRVTILGF